MIIWQQESQLERAPLRLLQNQKFFGHLSHATQPASPRVDFFVRLFLTCFLSTFGALKHAIMKKEEVHPLHPTEKHLRCIDALIVSIGYHQSITFTSGGHVVVGIPRPVVAVVLVGALSVSSAHQIKFNLDLSSSYLLSFFLFFLSRFSLYFYGLPKRKK